MNKTFSTSEYLDAFPSREYSLQGSMDSSSVSDYDTEFRDRNYVLTVEASCNKGSGVPGESATPQSASSCATYDSEFPNKNYCLQTTQEGSVISSGPNNGAEKPQQSDSDSSHGRKKQRNLIQIAEHLLHTYPYRKIDGRVYCFIRSNWVMTTESTSDIETTIWPQVSESFPMDADTLKTGDYLEIFRLMRMRLPSESGKRTRPDNQSYLCCENGVYQLSTGAILSPDPGLDLFYHLNADVKEIGCGNGYYTEMFLNNASNGDSAVRKRILQMAAAVLTAAPIKKFFFLEGASNTGKSQLIKFLEGILGHQANHTLSSIDELSEKWTVGGLVDKLMCSCPDVPRGYIKNTTVAKIKQIAGDDQVRGELKGVNPFHFDCYAKLVFGSNFPFRVYNPEDNEALLKRMVYIPFQNPVPEDKQIPLLYQHLLDETGYFLGLVVEEWRHMNANNWQFSHLDSASMPEMMRPDDVQRVVDFKRKYLVESPSAKIPSNVIYESFMNSEFGNAIGQMECSRFCKLLKNDLSQPIVTLSRNSSTRFICGVELTNLIQQ